MLEVFIVAPAVFLFEVFGGFALMFHKLPLLINECSSQFQVRLCPNIAINKLILQWPCASFQVVRRMSSAWRV